MEIRHVELRDKASWYSLDRHLPEAGFDEKYRGRGLGKQLMEHWESDMKSQGYGMLMTSTQVDEEAQHFYRKLGYKDCGGFVVDVPGYEQPMEMIMIKAVEEV